MATVGDVNKTFAEKGIYVEIPLASHLTVRGIEIMEKISQKRALAASRWTLENEYLVLLRAVAERFDAFEQAVREQTVREKGTFGPGDKQLRGIVMNKIDRFRMENS